ncbi:hypothetical protein GE09DRAFT_714251 [Coniochaeta sp. 2T2.1]|nr:hypothetical protein GE09DRAFT_714251 [Coniochaeta sp. 2T2.1]
MDAHLILQCLTVFLVQIIWEVWCENLPHPTTVQCGVPLVSGFSSTWSTRAGVEPPQSSSKSPKGTACNSLAAVWFRGVPGHHFLATLFVKTPPSMRGQKTKGRGEWGNRGSHSTPFPVLPSRYSSNKSEELAVDQSVRHTHTRHGRAPMPGLAVVVVVAPDDCSSPGCGYNVV